MNLLYCKVWTFAIINISFRYRCVAFMTRTQHWRLKDVNKWLIIMCVQATKAEKLTKKNKHFLKTFLRIIMPFTDGFLVSLYVLESVSQWGSQSLYMFLCVYKSRSSKFTKRYIFLKHFCVLFCQFRSFQSVCESVRQLVNKQSVTLQISKSFT